MYEFAYCAPGTVEEAIGILAQDEDALPLSGGMTLLPTMKQRLRQPSRLVDLNRIPSLSGIHVNGEHLVIGSTARHTQVASSPDVSAFCPALAGLAGNIGDPQVRNRGTIGGSIANNDPAADYPGAVLALDATVITNKREIPGDDFFTGMFSTCLEEGELVTAVRFVRPSRAAYVKFPNPASRYAIVGVFVAEMSAGVRVAVTGAGPCAFRWHAAEAAMAGGLARGSIANLRIEGVNLNDDIHASADYRAHLATIILGRAVAAAFKD